MDNHLYHGLKFRAYRNLHTKWVVFFFVTQ